VLAAIGAHPEWIARPQGLDYGVDLEAELAEPAVAGQLLKLQIKSRERIAVRDAEVRLALPRSLVRYAATCRVPVILVGVDVTANGAWYLWVQRWLWDHRDESRTVDTLPRTITVWTPTSDTLDAGLCGPLQAIARWETPIQLATSLVDATRIAISTRSTRLATSIWSLVGELVERTPAFPVGALVDTVLQLGEAIRGTWEGAETSQMLYELCRLYAQYFTAEEIERLVVRGESYSRTGITALGILYDTDFAHVVSLDLPRRFASAPNPRLTYYCRLRERHPGTPLYALLGDRKALEVDGWHLDDELGPIDLLEQWANRGDSALLDYIEAPPATFHL
jgi:hypothetical protein